MQRALLYINEITKQLNEGLPLVVWGMRVVFWAENKKKKKGDETFTNTTKF